MSKDAENIIPLYETHAQKWDHIRRDNAAKGLMETQWLKHFTSLLPHQGSVLDIGCGAGEPMAGHLIRAGFQLTGVDSSASLIDICRTRFPQQQWLVADMRELSLPQKFDGMLAWNSFFHLQRDEQRRMFPRFAVHAQEDAVLMFTSGTSNGEAIGTLEGQPLYHSSLAPEEYRTLLSDNGFDVMQYVENDPHCGNHTVWLCRKTT
ncbi:class I SAM-dependent methyltransferase [Ochrobactrum sp. SFR4]|uniref:class I SAM-dependent DNA methyltransferase n=1 Tax=Ochrobactrum sp. SFR4 TaxID=2717368 RepID=UPI001C8B78A2|nr:class I SAM-dependent methyltransferase [Ochrobactrum sp. SFR4]MBX8824475.1 methyltransferase domain-containing protein [Ochrobactrum sp. SFR4]